MKLSVVKKIACILLSLLVIHCNRPEKHMPQKPPAKPASIDPDPSPAWLSPEESMKTIHLPEGYHLELVASEPVVQEPVAIAWDGDGRMFVAEMRTYMKDVDGTGQDLPQSRISLLEDTDGDGKADKSRVFIDSLVLPRMILPLDDRLLVNETYSYNIYSYRDTNGDGKADEKKLMYGNDTADKRNLEHQKSGLVWNIDNWIYTTNPVRFRYVNGMLQADTLEKAPFGQWGLGKDDYGRLFFSLAGGEVPAWGFQQNPAYGPLELQDQYEQDFQAVWPIIGTPDVQGGSMRVRADSTLNHFTACCGQSVFCGDRLPADLRGDLLICEPVGRLIRRAKVMSRNGKVILKNAYDHAEMLASTDMNFRPVNTATGPDGCLYIVDMYHGIIQESNWTKEGSYLRPRILQRGLDKHTGRGRIYRLVHDGYRPGPRPHMLTEPTPRLVSYLAHSNGWWRDNAQKLIILRGDRSVTPALERMALGEQTFSERLCFWKDKPAAVARIHALWTLEGLHALPKDILFRAFRDEDPQVRKAAVWISETYLKQEDASVIEQLRALVKDTSADVRMQLSLSLRRSRSPMAKAMISGLVAENGDNELLAASWNKYREAGHAKMLDSSIAGKTQIEKRLIRQGAVVFNQLCSTCHGPDGKGLAIAGKSMVAPPLAGQQRISGNKNVLIRILLHGLSGPVDGTPYPDVMPSMGANTDEWIAAVLSYIRNDMGHNAAVVTPEEVKQVRALTAGRQRPWTLAELEK